MITLKNELLRVNIALQGAELKSVTDNINLHEYMWQADSEYWGRTAPILFPIVGKLMDDHYFVNGKKYTMTQHGFARDAIFTCVEQSDVHAEFVFKSSEKTHQKYPFDFILTIRYELIHEKLNCYWYVENSNESNILPFSIGGHPAFNLRCFDADAIEDFYLEFDTELELKTWNLENGCYGNTYTDFGRSDSLKITPEYFKGDALVFEHAKMKTISLRNMKNDCSVAMDLTNFNFGTAQTTLGIWSPYSDGGIAPFLCIEPWFGYADTMVGPFELKDKPGIICLEAKEKFATQYSLTFN